MTDPGGVVTLLDRRVEATQADEPDAEALIREARRRRRRRWAISTGILLGVSGLVLGSVAAGGDFAGGGRGETGGSPPPDHHAGAPSLSHPTTTRIALPTAPQFDQVVAGGGTVFVFGNANWNGPCTLARVDPTTLARVESTLPACGVFALYGDGAALVLSEQLVRGTAASVSIRLERVDPVTGRAKVFAPVDFVFDGSAIAHAAVAYGDGALWIAGDDDAVPSLVEVSPTTGAIEQRWTLPGDAGAYSLAAGPSGAFVAPGTGAGADFGILTATPGTTRLRSVSGLSGDLWATWLVPTGHDVIGNVVFRNAGVGATSVHSKLVRLTPTGRSVYSITGDELVSDVPPLAGPLQDLWGVTPGESGCAGETLTALAPATGGSRRVVRFASGGCDFAGNFDLVATTDGAVFLLARPGDGANPADLVRVQV